LTGVRLSVRASTSDRYANHTRSTGHIGSFVTLITRGCFKAIRTGAEQLTAEVLDTVRIDIASEQARGELAAAFAAGRLSTTPRATRRAKAS